MRKRIGVIGILLSMSAVVHAGPLSVKLGISYVDVTGKSDLANGTLKDAQASDVVAFTPSIEYRFGDTPFSTEVLLANAMKHSVQSNGTTIATLQQLPPTITVKYNTPEFHGFSAYVGAGATVFIPWDVQSKVAGAKLDADVGYGPAAQLGMSFKPDPNHNWGVFTDVRYAKVNTRIKANDADIGKLDIDPLVVTAGYRINF